MRVLPSDPPTFKQLGIEEQIIKNWEPRQGMIVVTGPTGSGKTTLLAAGIRHLLEGKHGCGKVLSYEAPIEYTYDNVEGPHSIISQTEIPRHLPDFYRGVRNALRRKPEIIMVGESRDRETISASIEAGQTGHTVYTTTHTTGVAATVRRMISTFDPDERAERAYALMETLRMVITQALVPEVGGGRLGVREWMVFDDIVREKLLDMDFNQWAPEIQRMIDQFGQTMEKSATMAFEEGLIERRPYPDAHRTIWRRGRLSPMQCEIQWGHYNRDQWQDILNRCAHSTLLQSYYYAQAMREAKQQGVRHGLIVIDGQEAGCVQMQEVSLFKRLVHGLSIDRGPLWFDGFGKIDHLKAFAAELDRQFHHV